MTVMKREFPQGMIVVINDQSPSDFWVVVPKDRPDVIRRVRHMIIEGEHGRHHTKLSANLRYYNPEMPFDDYGEGYDFFHWHEDDGFFLSRQIQKALQLSFPIHELRSLTAGNEAQQGAAVLAGVYGLLEGEDAKVYWDNWIKRGFQDGLTVEDVLETYFLTNLQEPDILLSVREFDVHRWDAPLSLRATRYAIRHYRHALLQIVHANEQYGARDAAHIWMDQAKKLARETPKLGRESQQEYIERCEKVYRSLRDALDWRGALDLPKYVWKVAYALDSLGKINL